MEDDFDEFPGSDEFPDEPHHPEGELNGEEDEKRRVIRVKSRWRVAAHKAHQAAREAEEATAKLFSEDSFFEANAHKTTLIGLGSVSNMLVLHDDDDGPFKQRAAVAPLARDESGDMADAMLKHKGNRTRALLSDRWRPHTPSRWPTLWDFLVGTGRGKFLLLGGIAVVLVGGGAVVWARVCGENRSELSTAQFWQTLWLSWGLFFDPGTQTGVAADDYFAVKFVALVLSVFGFIFNLTVLGVVVDAIRSLMDKWERTRSRLICNGHTLILGWTDKTVRARASFLKRPLRDLIPPPPRSRRSSSYSASCSRSSAGARSASVRARPSGGVG